MCGHADTPRPSERAAPDVGRHVLPRQHRRHARPGRAGRELRCAARKQERRRGHKRAHAFDSPPGPRCCLDAGLFNFLSNSGAFLVTATTNCVAAALADASAPGRGAERASVLLGHAMLLALALGGATAGAIALAPDTVLSLYGAAPGSSLAAASKAYLLVRAVSIPSMFLMFVAVGASLGAGNAVAPTAGILAAAVVNLVGDTVLVLCLGAGLAGAAAATAAASWAGTCLVLARLRSLVRPVFKPPRLRDVAPLLAVSGALLTTQLTSSLVYSYTTTCAARAGHANAAAHQICLQFWWLISYAPVPVYLAAQSLLGRHLGRGDTRRAQATIRVLLRLGGALCVVLAGANYALPLSARGAFTDDAAVLSALVAVLPAACVAQALATVNTTVEGIFAGAGRLRYVAAVAVCSSTLGVLAMRAAPTHWGLGAPWWGLVAFEAARVSAHALSWRAFADDVASGRARGAVPPEPSAAVE